MRKVLLASVFMILASPLAFAARYNAGELRIDLDFDPRANRVTKPASNADNANSFGVRQESDEILNEYINRKREKYVKDKYVRTMDYKNRYNQQERHIYSRWLNHTPQTSTQMERDGVLNTIPDYSERREYSTPSSTRANAKQVFRARWVDYLYGGDAGSEALRQGVVKSSEHRIDRAGILRNVYGGEVVKQTRDMLRNLPDRTDREPAGRQLMRSTNKYGSSFSRNYTHPFEKEFLQQKQLEEDFFSTEAE